MTHISVITTLFNYKNYIGSCIESFLSQNFTDSEMIIIDDCSTDNPMKSIKKYISERVRYYRLDKNMGYSFAKNFGIKHAKFEILSMLDADDMLYKDSLHSRYKKIQSGFDFVHGPALDLENGKLKLSKLWAKWLKSSKDEKSYKMIHAQTVMLKKDIHRKVGLYDESLKCKSDREMWARIMSRQDEFKVSYVNDPVSIYRVHKNQMHRSDWKIKNNDKLQRDVLDRIARRRKNLSDCTMLGDENGFEKC